DDAKAAAEQFQAARAIYDKYPDDRNLLRSMAGLANCHDRLGRHAEALQLNQETLAGQQALLGPTHHDTLKTRNNIANGYLALARPAEARKLHEETLALWQ